MQSSRTAAAHWDGPLAHAALDALHSHICVVDAMGTILAVNKPWTEFGRANGAVPRSVEPGASYLAVCDRAVGEDAAYAVRMAAGTRAVIAGEAREFSIDYPCTTAARTRWFAALVSPVDWDGPPCFVIEHVDITGRKAVEAELSALVGRLRRFASHEDREREAERDRVAYALHEELGSSLAAVRLDLAALGRPHAHALDAIDASIAVVRRITSDLRPRMLDQLGPWDAIEWYARSLAERGGFKVALNLGATLDHATIAPHTATTLFRIVQEAIENVLMHARASRLDIAASVDARRLVVEVTDDGVGFDASALASRAGQPRQSALPARSGQSAQSGQSGQSAQWGLFGAIERARAQGGRAEVTSAPGRGTTLRIELPIEAYAG